MTWTLLAPIVFGTMLSAPYPDALDIIRTGGLRPRMNLLLDSSCSMGNGERNTTCGWFADNYNGGSRRFNKNEQMRAVLVGCEREADGILDKWTNRVEFAIHDFRGLQAGFGSSLEALKTAVVGVPVRGGTPLSRTLDRGGEYLDGHSSDANTELCQPFFQLMLSDGDPNGGNGDFRQDCVAPVEHRRVPADRPWEGAEYLFDRHDDVLCGLSGNQQIRTFTLGFGRQGDYNPEFLRRIAAEGGGAYFAAREVPELVSAFDAIMATVAARGQPLAQVTLGQEDFFTGNRAYSVSYQPQVAGPWIGNVRRLCVAPPRISDGTYDTDVRTCLLYSDDGQTLLTNPAVRDQWTDLSAQGTASGGAGALLRSRLGDETPSPPYWTKRNVVTWRPGTQEWVPVRPDVWQVDDARVHGCERYRLINFLHGYTLDADCQTGAPLAVRTWPLANTVHTAPLELRYGPCDGSDGRPAPKTCFLLVATNDGQLHVFDAADGSETSAVIPAEFWGDDRVTRSRLSELQEQPSPVYTHRYYLDGALDLAHVDIDGDGVIDSEESAHVLFSMGRGGRGYYALDVSKMSDGVVDDEVPILPILPRPGLAFAELSDTWASPVFAEMRIGRHTHRVAVFVTGHEPLYDVVERDTSGPPHPLVDESLIGTVQGVDCSGSGGFAEENGFPSGELCDDFYESECAGTAADPCYDGTGLPLDLTTFALGYSDGTYRAAALRFAFSTFDLGPDDVLRLEDHRGTLVAEYRGQQLEDGWSDWVHGPRAALRLITDGRDSPNEGFRIRRVEWRLGPALARVEPSRSPPLEPGVFHRPALVVHDLPAFGESSASYFDGLMDDEGVLLKVTKEGCDGLGSRCLDASRAPDLEYLVCPISGQPAPYFRDARLSALYFGDECGQLFKLYSDENHRWSVRRLINLNQGELRVSKDHRKIFRRLDVVESLCPGQEVVGIYFGTGNVQRPLAVDELQQSSATDGADILGVLWDHPELPNGLTQDDLFDATEVDRVDPESAFASGRVGWRLHLGANERMLRDPLVLDGVALYKTFQPKVQPTACEAGNGTDRVYAVDNCTAAAVIRSRRREDREVWSGNTDGGPELMLLAPKDSPPMVTHADISISQPAALGPERPRRPGLFFWREVP